MASARTAALALVLVLPLVGMVPGDDDTGFASECDPAIEAPILSVGVVNCIRMASQMVGGVTAFSYYIPPACDPALGRDCPVLYYLHGTGGNYNQSVNLGPKGTTDGPWIRALTHGPPVSPYEVDDPWRFTDTDTWVPQVPIDVIIVTPHGLTVPGGHGPVPHGNTFWFDWNPRYAAGGDSQRYDTPPPRFESHIVHELIPYVDRWFPTDGTRAQRAINGKSMGGIGALMLGLKHPDLWASVGSMAGGSAGFPVLAGEDAVIADVLPIGVAPPTDLGHVRLPGLAPTVAPDVLWEEVLYGDVATVGFGDLAADHVWFRANQAADHVGNARAWGADGRQSVHVKYHVGDAVPRRAEDFTTGNYHFDQGFETILMPNNLALETIFARHGVERDFNLHPGLHSTLYQRPYYRDVLEQHYARMRHHDGGGDPLPAPVRFDHRSVASQFEAWGWQVSVDRDAIEFLNLTDVTCQSLTLRGSGTVTVTVPATCRTGVNGSRTFTVDLGPTQPVDEPGGIGSSRLYGRTVTVDLDPLARGACPPPSQAPHCN